jgi:hypothetical protein
MIAAVILLPLYAPSIHVAAQISEKMLCVHVAGDELGTLTHDFRQNFFAISVNRCHVNQVNEASPRVLYVVGFAPGRLELSRPLADQLTLQQPPLLRGRLGYSDPEHCSPSTASQKPPTFEACNVLYNSFFNSLLRLNR